MGADNPGTHLHVIMWLFATLFIGSPCIHCVMLLQMLLQCYVITGDTKVDIFIVYKVTITPFSYLWEHAVRYTTLFGYYAGVRLLVVILLSLRVQQTCTVCMMMSGVNEIQTWRWWKPRYYGLNSRIEDLIGTGLSVAGNLDRYALRWQTGMRSSLASLAVHGEAWSSGCTVIGWMPPLSDLWEDVSWWHQENQIVQVYRRYTKH